MRLVLTLACVVILVVGAFKLFYHPATIPALLAPPPPVPAPSAPQPVVMPDRSTAPPPSVLTPDQLKRVLETTSDPNPNVRWEAVKFLKRSHAPQADSVMAEMLTHDTDTSLRRNVVQLFADSGGPDATRQIVVALHDMEPSVRVSALNALNHLGDYTAAPAISELLQDTDDAVRLSALSTLNALQVKRDEEIRLLQAREAERKRQEELMRQQQQQQGR